MPPAAFGATTSAKPRLRTAAASTPASSSDRALRGHEAAPRPRVIATMSSSIPATKHASAGDGVGSAPASSKTAHSSSPVKKNARLGASHAQNRRSAMPRASIARTANTSATVAGAWKSRSAASVPVGARTR